MTGGTPATPAPRPILLTGLASSALLDGRGDLELPREMRGTVVECGGVIGQCVRLTSAWRVSVRVGDEEVSLPASWIGGGATPGAWTTRHRVQNLEIVQEVAAVSEVPGVARTLRLSAESGPPATVTVTSGFSPVLAPVLVEGIQPHRFLAATSADQLLVRQRSFALAARSVPAPARLLIDRASWIGGRREGRWSEVGLEYDLAVAPSEPAELRLLIYGGLARSLDGWEPGARAVLEAPDLAARSVDAEDRAWVERTPRLEFPDAPSLTAGYERARAWLRRLYSSPGDGLTGLVAGYPWYAAIWCRDLAWMLEAVAWLGDLEWMRASMDTVLRFQCRAPLPLLAGETGELPMQIAPGPIFLYGTSDTSLYFPLGMERWLRHAGAPTIPDGWAEAIGAIVAWGEARTDPATGLIRNGGEVEEISAAEGDLAQVSYGIDAPDTTIWDSADRREHAVDVQVLWAQSLQAALDLTAGRVAPAVAERWRGRLERVRASLRSLYPWEEERYLYDSLRDGRGVAQVRPNALRAVSAGFLPEAMARAVVARARADDLLTAWGVRTLSARDPSYDPAVYHEGQVWTIATAWLADAALAAGERELGGEVLARIAGLLTSEALGANECFRGDRPEPFDSCFVLGFSVGPFVATLFHRLWGISMDARTGELAVRPAFPAAWRSARIERLRVGSGFADLDWSAGQLTVRWTGPGALTVRTGRASGTAVAGGSVVLAAGPGDGAAGG